METVGQTKTANQQLDNKKKNGYSLMNCIRSSFLRLTTMKLHHLFVPIFLSSCFIPLQAMDKRTPCTLHDTLKVETVRNRQKMLRHIADQNLPLHKADRALYENFGEKYEKIVFAPLKFTPTTTYQPGINFEQALTILIAANPDIQYIILNHMNLESHAVKDHFLKIPLPEALERYAEYMENPLYVKYIPLRTLFFLNQHQFRSLKNIIFESLVTRETNEYVDEKTEEPINKFALISDTQKQLLYTLPEEFVLNEEARAVLSKIVISYKQPKLKSTANTLLHLFLNTHRPTHTSHHVLNPVYSRPFLVLSLAASLTLTSFLFPLNNTLDSIIPSLCFHYISTFVRIESFPVDNNVDNMSIVKSPTSLIKPVNIGIGVITSLNIMFQKGIMRFPFRYISTGLTTVFAPFMAYDYFVHGVKDGIKTQSILDLINTPACPKKSFCTLL